MKIYNVQVLYSTSFDQLSVDVYAESEYEAKQKAAEKLPEECELIIEVRAEERVSVEA